MKKPDEKMVLQMLAFRSCPRAEPFDPEIVLSSPG